MDDIPHVQHRPSPPTLQAFAEAHPEKRRAMATAYLSGGYTMKAIATYFGVHYSTVSRAVRWAETQGLDSTICLCKT